MGRASRRRISPALLVSIAALVLAGGGTAFGRDAVAFIAKAAGLSSKQKKQVTSIADGEIAAKASGLSVPRARNQRCTSHPNSSSATAFTTSLGSGTPTTVVADGTDGLLAAGSGSFQVNTTIDTFVTGTTEYVADLTLGQDLPGGAANTCFADAVINMP